jgi:hypothetical protein
MKKDLTKVRGCRGGCHKWVLRLQTEWDRKIYLM